MTSKAENVTEWIKRMPTAGRSSGAGASVSRLSLAAFGKHPGWEDHIPGIGVDTETLANLKQALYFDGIRGQIDSGAWEKMEQIHRLEGFDHQLLWLRQGHTLLGLMWSSSDRIGRAKYPMILCADGEGFSPAFMLAYGRPELERLRDTCKTLTSAEEVTSECRVALDRVRGTFERASGGWSEPFSDAAERQRFLDCAELSPDRAGLLRILHEYSTEQGMGSTGTKTKHLRVPVISSLQIDALTPWVEFFRCIVPSKVPVLFIKRNDAAWLDVIIGEPDSRDFFCLQAATDALPLTTQIPYEISPDIKSALDVVAARLGLSSGTVRQSSPKASPTPIAGPGVPAASGSGARTLIAVGVIILVVLAGVALVLFFKSNNPPANNAPAAPNKSGTSTGGANPVAAQGLKYETAIQSATDAFAKGDYDDAIRQANIALECEPGDQAATQIKADAMNKKRDGEIQDRTYTAAMTASQNALAAGNYDEAIRQIRKALAVRPGDSAAMTLDAIVDARQQADAKARDGNYGLAIAKAHEALADENYDEAIHQAQVALGLKAGDVEANGLLTQARNMEDGQQRRQKYVDAMKAAQQAFDGGNYPLAIQQVDSALLNQPGDADAAALKTKAENAQAAGDTRKQGVQYQSDVSAVQDAWNKGDFGTVIQHADRALQVSPDQPDIKAKLRDSVYAELEVFAVWFSVIKPENASFAPAKRTTPLAEGSMPPSQANQYKNQIDGWRKLLDRYQLMDNAHAKMAQAIEENIDRY